MQYDPRFDSLPRMPWPEGGQRFAKQIGPPIEDAVNKRRFVTRYGSHPLDIFTPAVNRCSVPGARWIYTDNEGKASIIVFTSGACLNNGQAGARGGYGIMYGPLNPGLSAPLERAPDGSPPTSNRAELRAVVGALTMRYWPGEGFFRIVIATDSEYVVSGATQWCQKWVANGWKTASGAMVKNQDLWKMVLEKMEEYEADGFAVQFFQISREWNEAADDCARRGAAVVGHSFPSRIELH